MKLNFEISIDADLETVWSAFDNPDNMRRWRQNFHSRTHLSGVPGKVGSIAELCIYEKGKIVTFRETITERRDKHFLAATYESARGKTIVVNRFEKIDESTTHWSSWCKIVFSGITRLLKPVLSRTIRKRTEGDMQRFKLMVETDGAGLPS